MPGPNDFLQGLRQLGFEARMPSSPLVVFDYEVELGPLGGRTFAIGLQVPPDWPLNPPGGPIIAPRFLPIHPGQDIGHPYGGVHENATLGVPGHYLSRPFPRWPETDRTVNAYLGHLRHLFDTLPDELQHSPHN